MSQQVPSFPIITTQQTTQIIYGISKTLISRRILESSDNYITKEVPSFSINDLRSKHTPDITKKERILPLVGKQILAFLIPK